MQVPHVSDDAVLAEMVREDEANVLTTNAYVLKVQDECSCNLTAPQGCPTQLCVRCSKLRRHWAQARHSPQWQPRLGCQRTSF